MTTKLQTFSAIMLFYALLACVIMPFLFYYLGNKTFGMAGQGFIVGSIISILLWLFYGSKLV